MGWMDGHISLLVENIRWWSIDLSIVKIYIYGIVNYYLVSAASQASG